MKETGGCLCGAVRFEVTGRPGSVIYCHCRMCQKMSGSVVTTWAEFAPEAFSVTQGEVARHQSSTQVERGFCAHCGSTLLARRAPGWEEEEDYVAIATGAFDRPETFPPDDAHAGIESQVPWLKIDDHLPRKTTMDAMGYDAEKDRQ
ncbi:MAG: GFA family protein [Pseudomonadota bacterium]